jgi:putative ABC transport system permease protein
MIDLARKMLFHDRVRFLITVGGIAFAVTLVVVQVGLFAGLLGNATVTIDHADADLWITSRNTPNIDFPHAFPESYVERVRSVPGVLRADNLIVHFVPIMLPSGAEETAVVYAMQDFKKWGLPWDVAEGDLDDLRRGPFMFLDDSATKRLGAFRVGEHREVAGLRVEIVGRTRDAMSFTTMPIVFMDYRLAQHINPDVLSDRTMYTVVKLAPGADAASVAAQIRERLPFNDVHTRAEWSRRSRMYWLTSTGLGLNMYLTVFLGCLVGVAVVAQTLYASTMEHLKEFGTLKAMGGTNADVYAILSRQALMSAVAGFAIGMIPSFVVAKLAARAGLRLVASPELLVAVFFGTLVLCVLAASISFKKIASIDPALVFRG